MYKFSETLDENMEESHLRGLPFDHGIKNFWRLVVSYKERELADLKYQKKKLNLFLAHLPEALVSSFVGFFRSYRFLAPLFTKFCIKVCYFIPKCS